MLAGEQAEMQAEMCVHGSHGNILEAQAQAGALGWLLDCSLPHWVLHYLSPNVSGPCFILCVWTPLVHAWKTILGRSLILLSSNPSLNLFYHLLSLFTLALIKIYVNFCLLWFRYFSFQSFSLLWLSIPNVLYFSSPHSSLNCCSLECYVALNLHCSNSLFKLYEYFIFIQFKEKFSGTYHLLPNKRISAEID